MNNKSEVYFLSIGKIASKVASGTLLGFAAGYPFPGGGHTPRSPLVSMRSNRTYYRALPQCSNHPISWVKPELSDIDKF